jgi:peptidylprolyl isomerase/FKBP-type peptidyl-prolyl cis-trans isomerase FkpA
MKKYNQQESIAVVVSIVVVLIFFVLGWINYNGGSDTKKASITDTAAENTASVDQAITNGEITKEKTMSSSTVTSLVIEDLKLGDGVAAKSGDLVSVNYLGKLTDGKIFDTSYQRNEPFTFSLGKGRVIKGWDQGIVGMKVGGKRRLTIPPDLGYGADGYPPVIPKSAVLIFEVELLSTKSE